MVATDNRLKQEAVVASVCFPFSADIPVGGGHSSAMLLMNGLSQSGVRIVLALHGSEGPAGRWLTEQGECFHQVRFPAYAGGATRNWARDAAFLASQSRCVLP